MKKKLRALVLLSGGLDSILAVKILQEQGVEVTGLGFKSCFFDTLKARESLGQLNIPFREVDFSIEHLQMTKNPKCGYGKNINPCIDCHALMLQFAKKIIQEEDFDFVATGEVLGQRPMSQNRVSLQKVAKMADLEDNLLRPLSAKLLAETVLEKTGKIERNKLQDIQGRGRERQFALAQEYEINKYPSPGGGCLLTDINFEKKLRKLLANWPDCAINDVALLKVGRNYWFQGERGMVLLVVGRDSQDNENMLKLKREGDIVIDLLNESGPRSLLRGLPSLREKESILTIKTPLTLDFAKVEKIAQIKNEKDILRMAAALNAYYATKLRGLSVDLQIKQY